MRLVTYNIQYSKGKDGRYNLGRIADALDGADVIALQEVERNWPRTGMVDQAAELSALLPAYYWVYGPGFDMDASEISDDGIVTNRRRQFGNMILARWPLSWSRVYSLPKLKTFDQFNMDMLALEAVIDAPGAALRVLSIHLSYISCRERMVQIDYLLGLHDLAAASGGAWTGTSNIRGDGSWSLGALPPAAPHEAIWMGDFNAEPGGPEYDAIVGPKDPVYGRVRYADRFADAWVSAGHDEADGKTRPFEGTRPDKRLDYCFVSAALAERVRAAHVDMDAEGSDHQPVWVDIDL
jgi:endonuclease/exonuclease/phosphatase family metal-dependent hydrolase